MVGSDFGLSCGEELLQLLASNIETPNGIIVFLAMQNRLFSSAQHLAVSKLGSLKTLPNKQYFGKHDMWSKIMSGLSC